MAKEKNTHRSKRKYSDKRRAITDANRKRRQERHDLRVAVLVERTRNLIGTTVYTGKLGREVLDIVPRPDDAKRPGTYLQLDGKDYPVARARVRVPR